VCVSVFLCSLRTASFGRIWTKFGKRHRYTLRVVIAG